MLSSDDTFGFKAEIWLLLVLFKVLYRMAGALKRVGCYHFQNDFYPMKNGYQKYEVS